MATKTYEQMRSRILQEAYDGTPQDAAVHGAAVNNALDSAIRLLEGKRFWFLETTETLTLLSGDDSLSLPSDFKKHINLRIQVNNHWRGEKSGFSPTTYANLAEMREISTLPDIPEHWALFGTRIEVDREADANYTLELAYVRGDTSYPSADSDVSVWFEDHSQDLTRYTALSILATDYMHSVDWAAKWSARAEQFEAKLTGWHNNRNYKQRLA